MDSSLRAWFRLVLAQPSAMPTTRARAAAANWKRRLKENVAARAKAQPVFYSALADVIQGGLAPAPGGVLVRDKDGSLLGAVGVSGDVSDNDEAAALFGIQEVGLTADPGRD